MNKEVQAIRAEIERREVEVRKGNYYLDNSEQALGYELALNDMQRFIDSLPEEKPSKDLEDEIATWIQAHLEIKNEQFEIYREPMTKWAEAIARHFAKWGAEHQVIDGNKMTEPSEDSEEAAEAGARQYYISGGYSPFPNIECGAYKSGFLAGAQWQAEHTEDYPMPEDTVLFQKGVEEGKRLMMEEAIECYVVESENPCSESPDECLHEFSVLYSHKGKQPYPLAGQYIKLIIVEED